MEQIILHLLGDYIFQNDYIANTKTKNTFEGYFACAIHVLIHGILFLFIASNLFQVFLIVFSHFLIDKYRLAVYWLKFVNFNFKSNNLGFSDNTPKWMSVWLMIIVDNIFHITVNYLILKYII